MPFVSDALIAFSGIFIGYLLSNKISSKASFNRAADSFRDITLLTVIKLDCIEGLKQPRTIIRDSFNVQYEASIRFSYFFKGEDNRNFKEALKEYNQKYEEANNTLFAITDSIETQDETSKEYRDSALECLNKLLKHAEPK